ncbi:MAG TPA: flagellar protein FlaG [Syntrophales bacterium]|nr:flagellar protein FlaG [Syntrophales bacterium]
MNISNVSVSGAMTSAPVAAARHAPPPPAQGQVAQAAEVSSVQLKQMVAEMQNQINRMNVSLQFTTYGDSGENIAVVVADKGTGEVIREIPSKEIQQLYAKMNELSGMILSGKA